MGNSLGNQIPYCKKCFLHPWAHSTEKHDFIPNKTQWFEKKPTWQDKEAWRINYKFNEQSSLVYWIIKHLPKNYYTIENPNVTIVVISNGNWDFTLYSDKNIIAKGYSFWGSGKCNFINIQPNIHTSFYPPELLEDYIYHVI